MRSLKQTQISDVSSVRASYALTPLDDIYHGLVVSFAGRYGYGGKGNPDASAMCAMVHAGIEAFGPAGVVLDLRELVYEWGDQMSEVIVAGMVHDVHDVQCTIVVSDTCREAMRTLIEQEWDDDPRAWLFETIDAAFDALENRRRDATAVRELFLAPLTQVARERLSERRFRSRAVSSAIGPGDCPPELLALLLRAEIEADDGEPVHWAILAGKLLHAAEAAGLVPFLWALDRSEAFRSCASLCFTRLPLALLERLHASVIALGHRRGAQLLADVVDARRAQTAAAGVAIALVSF